MRGRGALVNRERVDYRRTMDAPLGIAAVAALVGDHAPARDGSGGGARRPAPGAHLLRPSGGPAWCDGDGGDAPPAASEAGGPRLLLDVRRRARPETARRARGEGPPGAPGIRAAMPRLERAPRTSSRRPRCRAGASLSRSLLGAPRQRGEN